jgi:hypothetical protein
MVNPAATVTVRATVSGACRRYTAAYTVDGVTTVVYAGNSKAAACRAADLTHVAIVASWSRQVPLGLLSPVLRPAVSTREAQPSVPAQCE